MKISLAKATPVPIAFQPRRRSPRRCGRPSATSASRPPCPDPSGPLDVEEHRRALRGRAASCSPTCRECSARAGDHRGTSRFPPTAPDPGKACRRPGACSQAAREHGAAAPDAEDEVVVAATLDELLLRSRQKPMFRPALAALVDERRDVLMLRIVVEVVVLGERLRVPRVLACVVRSSISLAFAEAPGGHRGSDSRNCWHQCGS